MKSAKAHRIVKDITSKKSDFDKVGKYDQNQVNGFDRGIIDSFLDLVDLPNCSTVLDAMSGDGNLTGHLFEYCTERGINVPSVFNLEFSAQQCTFAREKLKGKNAKVIWGDILTMKDLSTGVVQADNQYDAILLKSGNHEIPLHLQQQLYNSLYRVLKPGGRLVNLGVVFDDEVEQQEFREILRIKDTLAGLDDAAKNRHFVTRKEFYPMLQAAGFVDITCGRHAPYIGRTSVVADVYFSTDREAKKIEFEGALMKAVALRKKYQVFTLGDDSIYTFPGEMTVARKPKLALVR